MSHAERVINFSAGPAAMPEEVLKRAQADLLNYAGTGMSVMEMSHRGAAFKDIIERAEKSLRTLLSVPDNYKVLFLQGGGTGQFAAIPLNLLRTGKADYIVTGGWSEKAVKEAKKYSDNVAVANKPDAKFTDVEPQSQWALREGADYVYFCDNETVYGVEFSAPPETANVPLVADMSSNILSKEIDVSKYGLIFFGAQKNVGPAGVTVVIVREDLLGHTHQHCPSVLDFKTMADNGSMLNTPPTFSIYMCGLVFDWCLEQGGVAEMAKRAEAKSKAIYDVIDNSDEFYQCPVAKTFRSRMNIPFRIVRSDGTADPELEAKFLKEAEAQGMVQLKGHRSVGGIRASLYNAVPVEAARKLAEFLKRFQSANIA